MDIPEGYVMAEVLGVEPPVARFVVAPVEMGPKIGQIARFPKPRVGYGYYRSISGPWAIFKGQIPADTTEEALAKFLAEPKLETGKCLNAFKKAWCGA